MDLELYQHEQTSQYLSILGQLQTSKQVNVDVPPHLREVYLRLLVLWITQQKQKYKIHTIVTKGKIVLKRTYFSLQSILNDETILVWDEIYMILSI